MTYEGESAPAIKTVNAAREGPLAAPPKEREGTQLYHAGRRVVAGAAPFAREVSTGAGIDEVWSLLRTLRTPDVGFNRLRDLHGRKIDERAFRRIVAYLQQGESFYSSAHGMSSESRPLAAYYCVLNLTKALLTCLDPSLTSGKATHGLTDSFQEKQRYWFIHERSGVTAGGVFRELATRTGRNYCYASGEKLHIQRLAPYLVETIELYRDAVGETPRLLPLESLEVWTNKEAWLRAEVDRGQLSALNIGPASLPTRARHFGTVFRLIQSDETTASYEGKDAHAFTRKAEHIFPNLVADFGNSLIHVNRGPGRHRYFLVISDRRNLLSQEAVSFLVIHHLSNMVRYRPEQVDKLAEGKWFFLFTTWLPRALENYLLAVATRLLKEEIWIT